MANTATRTRLYDPPEAIPIPTSQPPEKNPPRARNELIDAIITATGGDPHSATKRALSAAGVALAEIKAVCPAITAEHLHTAAKAYSQKNRDWALTPSALAKNWHTLAPTLAAKAAEAEVNPYCHAPPNWRAAIAATLGVSLDVLDDKNWPDLDPNYRRNALLWLRKQGTG